MISHYIFEDIYRHMLCISYPVIYCMTSILIAPGKIKVEDIDWNSSGTDCGLNHNKTGICGKAVKIRL